MRQIPAKFKATCNFLPLVGGSGDISPSSWNFCNNGFTDVGDDVAYTTVPYSTAIVDLLEGASIGQIPQYHGQFQSRHQGWPPAGVNLHQSYTQMILEELEEVWVHSHGLLERLPVIFF